MPMPLGIGEARRDELVEAREHVADIAAAHVAHDEPGEFAAAAGRSAHVRLEHRVAALDQRETAVARRGVDEGPDRTAVDVQDRGEGRLAPRQRQEALDLESVGRVPAQAPPLADQLAASRRPGVRRGRPA